MGPSVSSVGPPKKLDCAASVAPGLENCELGAAPMLIVALFSTCEVLNDGDLPTVNVLPAPVRLTVPAPVPAVPVSTMPSNTLSRALASLRSSTPR